MDGYETPRSKIPIPLQTSQTQSTSVYETPISVSTPLSIKSEPNTLYKKAINSNPNHIQFVLKLVELILTNVKQLNQKISKKTLKYLNDRKQHKIVIESILMAPIINNLVRSCIDCKQEQIYKKQQKYQQLLSFLIDYFQQIHAELIWPKPHQILNIMNSNISKECSIRKSVEIAINVNKIRNNNDDKFEEFINKVTEIGNKFEILQNKVDSVNDNKINICKQIKDIKYKQQEFDKKLSSNNKYKKNDILSEWEKSHHHLGKKQQQNIDLLQHQTEKFENIAERIKNALKETEDPKIFESRLNFITQQTKELENKLDDVQESMTKKAKNLEKSVKNALNKYAEIENVTDLISIGVSPLNVNNNNDDNDNEEYKEIKQDEDEKKLSFLYKMSQSDTGFNYEKKKIEIKNIIRDVLDCKHKIDGYDDIKSFKHNIKKNNDYNIIDIEQEDDKHFMDRIKQRIEKKVSMLQHYKPKKKVSLNVHWRNDKNQIRYIQENDLNKLMSLKPGIARKYRENYNDNDNISIPSIPSIGRDGICFDYKINKPSIDNILEKVHKNLINKTSNHLFKESIPTKRIENNIKIIPRITQKPPELQFNSKPIPPSKPILFYNKACKHSKRYKNIKNIKKNKKIIKKQKYCKHNIDVNKSLISKSIQTLNLISSGIQTMDIIQSSVEQSINSMANSKEEQDTVNILLTHSIHSDNNNLNSFCDNVLNNLFTKNKQQKSIDIQSINIQNGEQNNAQIIHSIINHIISKSIIISENKNKQKLCVEDMINEQNIEQQINVNMTLNEEIETIIHISPKKPSKKNQIEIKTNKIIHSPICQKYNDKLKKLQKKIKTFSSPKTKINEYSTSSSSTISTSTSTSTSSSESSISSIATSMVSSLDSSKAKCLLSNIKITDSILSGMSGMSGISISESDTFSDDDDSSQFERSEEFDNLKESLNREWNEIKLALNNFTN